jgi:hypothetical protein
MSALKRKEIGKVRAEDAVGMIDCGQASKRTKGTYCCSFWRMASRRSTGSFFFELSLL